MPAIASRPRRVLLNSALLLVIGLIASTALAGGRARAAATDVTVRPEARLYVHAAGQALQGPWLAYWLGHDDHAATGLPVSGIVLDGDHYSQWFQYARLDVPLDALDATTAERVTFAPLGQIVATRADYATWLDAFQPVDGGPEGARYFPDTGHTISNGLRAAYERPGVPEQLGPPISQEFGNEGVVYQFFQFGALTWSPADGAQRVAIGTLDAVLSGHWGAPQPKPAGMLSDANPLDLEALSALLQGERWIDVDLTEHTVSAYIGATRVLTSTTVTGAPQSPTPRGTFSIYLKYREQTLDGVTWDGREYHEQDVPWVMYFYEDYAVHSSTWRTEFGFSDSPGCVIPPTEVAKQLWEFADYGTRVEVHN